MSFWHMKPVFVTGATGLVGGHLVARLLELGALVTCLVRDRVPSAPLFGAPLQNRVAMVYGDVTDQTLLERALGEYESEVVIHLAAQTIVGIAQRNPVATYHSNVIGTVALLEACRRSPKVGSIVVASSDKAYGEAKVLPYNEETPLDAVHPYDVSKACTDLVARSYGRTYNLPVIITRCGNFYGGGDLNWNRIVPGAMRSILLGEPIVLRSDGSMVRDYLYVEDGVSAYLASAEAVSNRGTRANLRGEAFNFSDERPLSVLALVDTIQRSVGRTAEVRVLGEPHREIPAQYLDSRRARETLGWRPSWSLEAGLRKTFAWYEAWTQEFSQPVRS